MHNKPQAFTLVELLIVIAIIGILASIAIPTYQSYLKRARFSEVMLATAPFKTAIALELQDGADKKDLDTGKNGIPSAPGATANLASIEVKAGKITAKATKKAGGYTYILTPDNNGAHWTVSGTCIAAKVCKS